jgi:hypothetical protein
VGLLEDSMDSAASLSLPTAATVAATPSTWAFDEVPVTFFSTALATADGKGEDAMAAWTPGLAVALLFTAAGHGQSGSEGEGELSAAAMRRAAKLCVLASARVRMHTSLPPDIPVLAAASTTHFVLTSGVADALRMRCSNADADMDGSRSYSSYDWVAGNPLHKDPAAEVTFTMPHWAANRQLLDFATPLLTSRTARHRAEAGPLTASLADALLERAVAAAAVADRSLLASLLAEAPRLLPPRGLSTLIAEVAARGAAALDAALAALPAQRGRHDLDGGDARSHFLRDVAAATTLSVPLASASSSAHEVADGDREFVHAAEPAASAAAAAAGAAEEADLDPAGEAMVAAAHFRSTLPRAGGLDELTSMATTTPRTMANAWIPASLRIALVAASGDYQY